MRTRTKCERPFRRRIREVSNRSRLANRGLDTLNLQVVYCNHETASLGVRERLSFSRAQMPRAYAALRSAFPQSEWVLLSACNRVEVYTAQEETEAAPSPQDVAKFFADFHQVPVADFLDDLLERRGPDVV